MRKQLTPDPSGLIGETSAAAAGFRTVEALPMRLRDQIIGALNPFRATPGPIRAGRHLFHGSC